MFNPLSNFSNAITLHLPTHLRVAGQTITGSVDVNVACAQKENIDTVRVKLRGSVKTHIENVRETVWLVRDDALLWTQGGQFPPPGSHVLTFPFTFSLPENLPPSFHCSLPKGAAAISYSIEVVGHRPGLWTRKQRIGALFTVVPAATPAQVRARVQLAAGATGPIRERVTRKQIRQGVWGAYSTVEAKITVPKPASFPIGTPIPFELLVTTRTKEIKQTETPLPALANGAHKQQFPAPPEKLADIQIRLERSVQIAARGSARSFADTAVMAPVKPEDAVLVTFPEPQWVSSASEGEAGETTGRYMRSVKFAGTFFFACSPSLVTGTLECRYYLRIIVPFSGIGNDLRWDIPVMLDSGVECPPRPLGVAGSSSAVPYGEHVYDQRLVLDLPPAYWTGEHHDWDEKS